MLGLLLVYWIGKYYYKLAEEYNKSKWGFAILGVLSYIIGLFLTGIILGIAIEIFALNIFNNTNENLISLLLTPFGIAICYGFYQLLKKNWKEKAIDSEIDLIK
ncbi:hypothetical protein [Aureivirga sp. CE67]|uniref:hypothetical protein n=1 Tax=Aureivirga sp. CE67 TaxID=1788983 RepID=UPI0018C9C4B8|nr:hypothetical protein [Aureivirga sp. CE67]